jgi:YCII-related domain
LLLKTIPPYDKIRIFNSEENRMSQFVFAYHGGKMPETEEEGAKIMARWSAWMGDLGDALVNPGAPVGMSKTVSSGGVADDGGSNPVSGFSIVEAANMEAAIEMSKGCPILDHGTVEIAECLSM